MQPAAPSKRILLHRPPPGPAPPLTPPPPSRPAIFAVHLLSELLTGLQQIDCQRCSQGPSIRLSLSLSVARPSGNEAFCSLFAAAHLPAPPPSLLFVPSKKRPLPSFVRLFVSPALLFSRSNVSFPFFHPPPAFSPSFLSPSAFSRCSLCPQTKDTLDLSWMVWQHAALCLRFCEKGRNSFIFLMNVVWLRKASSK